MKGALFIAWQDLRMQLRQGATLVWVFVMPPIFFYFIGTVTGGFSGTMSGSSATPLVVEASMPGFLRDQIDRRLRENDFETEWRDKVVPDSDGNLPGRVLSLGDQLSKQILAGQAVKATFETGASSLLRNYEIIRIQRAVYTVLADIVTADARSDGMLSAGALAELNLETRAWLLDVAPAGQRQAIPSGFEQTIPGILVMFTVLVLLTNGSTTLVLERRQGLLRRLAFAPISRAEVVAGKWGARMVLAMLQIAAAAAIGTLFFDMEWGPDKPMIVVVLLSWAAFCASAGLLLGSLARTEGQAAGLGVLTANVLAALGGCWWPIEVTPAWMQGLQNFMPTGWTMDALHKLISFEAGAVSAIPYVVLLLLGSLVAGSIAVRRFQYQ
jgi:ABC-2 type transport system permease protein